MKSINPSTLRNFTKQTFTLCLCLISLVLLAQPTQAALLIRYNFDEASGNALDSGTGTAANATLNGGATRTATGTSPSGAGTALSVNVANGTSAYAAATAPAKLNVAMSTLTLTTWINLQGNVAALDRIMANVTATSGFDLSFNGAAASSAAVLNFRKNTTGGGFPSSTSFDAANKWVFVACVYDSASSSVKYYTGASATAVAQLGTTVTYAGGGTITASTADFRVGSAAASASDRTPPGYFDDVRVYNSALTSAQLEAIRVGLGAATIYSSVATFPSAFSTTAGTASSVQTLTVSGSTLTANLVATAPTGFEVSSDGSTYGTTATFAQTDGIASGTLSVRLAASAAAGTYNSQNIVLSSTGLTSVNVATAASGNVVNAANQPTSPTGVGSSTPSSVTHGQASLLKVTVTPGTNPTSTGTAVTADLSSIGGSATQTFYDDGTHGDVTTGDNIFSFSATVAGGTSLGAKSFTASIADAQSRSGTASIALTVTAATATWSASPSGANWGTTGNWTSGISPAAGDFVYFDASSQLSPNLETGYTVNSVTFNSGASSYTIGGSTLTLTGGGVTNNSANVQTLNAPVAISTTPNINAASGNITLGGAVSGTGGITKVGGGTNILSGNNNYSGVTAINTGKINIQHVNALGATGAGNDTTVANGATLQLQGGFSFAAEPLSLASGSSASVILQNVSGDNTWNGTIGTSGSGATVRISSDSGTLTLADTVTGNSASTQVVLQGNGNILVNGKITGTSPVTSGSTGTGTRTLSNTANDFSGKVTATGGNLSFNSIKNVGGGASALGAPADATAGTIAIGGLAITGSLTYTGTGDTSDRVLNLLGTTGGATIDQSGASGLLKFTANLTAPGNAIADVRKTLTLQGSTAGTGEMAGIIPDSTAGVSGQTATSLTKSGSGTWTLSVVNTYSGNTTISAGKLALTGSGSIANSPVISIATSATFDVSGITPSGYTLTGSSPVQTLAGSSTNGTATVNATGKPLTLASGSLLSFQADGTGGTVGKISVTGDLNLNANAVTVNVTGAALVFGTNRLLDCTGTLTGSANSTATITGTALSSGYTATVVTDNAGKQVNLVVTGVKVPALSYTNAAGTSRQITLTEIQAAGLASSQVSPTYTISLPSASSNLGGNLFTDGSKILYEPSSTPGSDSFSYTVSDGVASGTATVSIAFTNAVSVSKPEISVVAGVINGTMYGIPGVQYDVQRSTTANGTYTTLTADLTPANPITAGSDGKISFQDTAPPSGSGFYRTIQH